MITTINEYKKINESLDGGLEALPVNVYKSGSDATNNGLTSKHDRLLLVFDNVSSPFKTEPDEDYLVMVRKNIGTRIHIIAVPKSIIDSGKHSMFGGNFIYTSDSRFPNSYPIPVHDRVEN